ncbi:LOW QUALITY PROTEIN: hypothetical protein ACHAXH_002514 [Discostella pseudostelligera]
MEAVSPTNTKSHLGAWEHPSADDLGADSFVTKSDYQCIGLLEPFGRWWSSWTSDSSLSNSTIASMAPELEEAQEQQPLRAGGLDRGWCLEILAGYGVGPKLIRLLDHFWSEAKLACPVRGHYGSVFSAGCGVTQGRILHVAFYADDSVLSARCPEWLQNSSTIVAGLFKHVSLCTNAKTMKVMMCIPGKIRVKRLRVECDICGQSMQVSSLQCHLELQHDASYSFVLNRDLEGGCPPATF